MSPINTSINTGIATITIEHSAYSPVIKIIKIKNVLSIRDLKQLIGVDKTRLYVEGFPAMWLRHTPPPGKIAIADISHQYNVLYPGQVMSLALFNACVDIMRQAGTRLHTIIYNEPTPITSSVPGPKTVVRI